MKSKTKKKEEHNQKIQQALDELALAEKVAIVGVREGQELYKFTKKGIEGIEKKLKEDENTQVFYFTLCYNMLVDDFKTCKKPLEFLKRVAKTSQHFEEKTGISFSGIVLNLENETKD